MDAHARDTDVSAEIAARLREAITGGRFMPNERLIEAELCELYDANRANIRMALAMLDQEGLVVRERNRGARVRLVSDAEAIEIAESRRALEAMVASQAAGRASPADHRALRKLIAEMKAAIKAGDLIAYSQINGRLHREIQRISGNATAERLLQTLNSHIVRLQYRAILIAGRAKDSLAEHQDIVDAICAGDATAAEAAMRRHLDRVVANIRVAIAATRPVGL